MSGRRVGKWFVICLILCAVAVGAHAETKKLALGYEVELQEGIVITNEVWDPDNNSIIYQIEGYYIEQDNRFMANVFLKDEKLENADKATSLINYKEKRVTGYIPEKGNLGIIVAFSWKMDDDTFLTAEDDVESFINDLVDMQIGERNAPEDYTVEEKTLPRRSEIFGKVIPVTVKGNVAISVAGGKYTISAKEMLSTDATKVKVFEENEGSVLGVVYGRVNTNGTVVARHTVYQYLPLPESFPKDIEYLPDDEYIEMLEKALNALAEEKAELLRELLVHEFNFKTPEIITNENLKKDHLVLQEQIESLNITDTQKELKQQQAISLCRYWEIFDNTGGYHRDYLLNGRRWREVNGALIGGYMGGIAHCAIFDNALHFIRGDFDLLSLTATK